MRRMPDVVGLLVKLLELILLNVEFFADADGTLNELVHLWRLVVVNVLSEMIWLIFIAITSTAALLATLASSLALTINLG
jgi:hypothetical protein